MKNIIIISEDYIFFKLLEQPLKKRITDANVIHYHTFEQIKTKLNQNDCHLIIADGVMSGVASFEIINYLRTEKKIIIPIFFISEVNNEYFKIKAFEVGVSEYYTKPINPFEISEAIEKRLINA